ncbi:MAG TPA: hypothetical protein VIH49_03540 [Solirubrobacteraceae bacterium]
MEDLDALEGSVLATGSTRGAAGVGGLRQLVIQLLLFGEHAGGNADDQLGEYFDACARQRRL